MHKYNYSASVSGMLRSASQSSECDRHKLLSKGWKIYERSFDFPYFQKVVEKEAFELFKKGLALLGIISQNLTRADFSLLSNILTTPQNIQPELQSLWDFITPVPPSPNFRHVESIGAQFPRQVCYSRNTIALEEAYLQLQSVLLFKIIEILGTPTIIRQEPQFIFPIEKFRNFDELDILDRTQVYWKNSDIWLEISPASGNQKDYILSGVDLKSWIEKASYNLAVIKSGARVRIGEIKSEYTLSSYPANIQLFTEQVIDSLLENNRTAVLLYGEPGTGKTMWTQSFAKEYLVQLGYVIFILDKDSIIDFSPPGYLKKVALIVNDCDNIAQDRSSIIAQGSSRTENILSLLDGTLLKSVIENNDYADSKHLAILMTCNTPERLDPAMLRKGRIDFIQEFTHKFV